MELKTEKLVTALYMVTDFIDPTEPLREKLRSLGLDLLTDIGSWNLGSAIETKKQIISLINIARTVCLISQNNADILLAEFRKSKALIENEFTFSIEDIPELNGTIEVSLPLGSESSINQISNSNVLNKSDTVLSIGHQKNIRDDSLSSPPLLSGEGRGEVGVRGNFGGASLLMKPNDLLLLLKNNRKAAVLNYIKDNSESSIKDICNIKDKAIRDCSEKTIQREIMSLIDEGLIKKTGEKRWSKYSLA